MTDTEKTLLKHMIKEAIEEQNLEEALKQALSDLEQFKVVDPRGYKDWSRKLLYLIQDIKLDLAKAKRFASIPNIP